MYKKMRINILPSVASLWFETHDWIASIFDSWSCSLFGLEFRR